MTFVGTGADDRFFRRLSILRQRHKVSLIHLVQEMHRFLALVVTVDDKIEHIAVFTFHRDKLLSACGGAADIVNERQVPIRGKGGAYIIGKDAAEHPQQCLQFFGSKGEGKAAALDPGFRVAHGHIVRIDIADALRQDDLQPVAILADYFHR